MDDLQICGARVKLPIKQLIRYSIVLSLAVTIFLFIMAYIQDQDIVMVCRKSIIGELLLLVASTVSITLIICFEREGLNDFKRHGILRLLIGGMINALFLCSVHWFRMFVEKYDLWPKVFFSVTDDTAIITGWQLYVVLIIGAYMVYGLVHLLHNFLLLVHLRTQTNLELSTLRTANAETTNQLLRQQIHPHFLFNALNVLKSLIKVDPKTAETYLIRLSDFLRTSFSQNKKGTATVREEVKLFKDYLEMQKIRFGEALEYTCRVQDEAMDELIPFFSLQPLVENAIKHNELTEQNPLIIHVNISDDEVTVKNNLQKKSSMEAPSGNGLFNLSERYRILTGEELKISDNGSFFSVTFRTIKNENRNH